MDTRPSASRPTTRGSRWFTGWMGNTPIVTIWAERGLWSARLNRCSICRRVSLSSSSITATTGSTGLRPDRRPGARNRAESFWCRRNSAGKPWPMNWDTPSVWDTISATIPTSCHSGGVSESFCLLAAPDFWPFIPTSIPMLESSGQRRRPSSSFRHLGIRKARRASRSGSDSATRMASI